MNRDRWFEHRALAGWRKRELLYQGALALLPITCVVIECRRVQLWCLRFPERN